MRTVGISLVWTAIFFTIGFYGGVLPGLLGPFTTYAGYLMGVFSLVFVFRNLILVFQGNKIAKENPERSEQESIRLDNES